MSTAAWEFIFNYLQYFNLFEDDIKMLKHARKVNLKLSFLFLGLVQMMFYLVSEVGSATWKRHLSSQSRPTSQTRYRWLFIGKLKKSYGTFKRNATVKSKDISTKCFEMKKRKQKEYHEVRSLQNKQFSRVEAGVN